VTCPTTATQSQGSHLVRPPEAVEATCMWRCINFGCLVPLVTSAVRSSQTYWIGVDSLRTFDCFRVARADLPPG
jgi:hypothetical protein